MGGISFQPNVINLQPERTVVFVASSNSKTCYSIERDGLLIILNTTFTGHVEFGEWYLGTN
jgi:hypothetical protein